MLTAIEWFSLYNKHKHKNKVNNYEIVLGLRILEELHKALVLHVA